MRIIRSVFFAIVWCGILGAPALAGQAVQGEPTPSPAGQAPAGQPAAGQTGPAAARDAARTSAMNALSPDHAGKVNAVIGQVKAGTLTDLRDAAKQIDAILSPAEAQSVLAARDKMRSDMRAATVGSDGAPGPPPGGPPPGGGAGPGGAGRGGRRGSLRNDAGFALLSLNLDPEQMRSIFTRQRPRP